MFTGALKSSQWLHLFFLWAVDVWGCLLCAQCVGCLSVNSSWFINLHTAVGLPSRFRASVRDGELVWNRNKHVQYFDSQLWFSSHILKKGVVTKCESKIIRDFYSEGCLRLCKIVILCKMSLTVLQGICNFYFSVLCVTWQISVCVFPLFFQRIMKRNVITSNLSFSLCQQVYKWKRQLCSAEK